MVKPTSFFGKPEESGHGVGAGGQYKDDGGEVGRVSVTQGQVEGGRLDVAGTHVVHDKGLHRRDHLREATNNSNTAVSYLYHCLIFASC